MNDLLEFLTSKEAVIVYVVAGVACLLCLLVYLIERNNVRLKQRHNTRELNKLVNQVKEEANIPDEVVQYEEPVLEKIEDVSNEEVPIRDEIIVEPLSNPEVEELQYTSIEPDMETAQLELQKITEELKRQEEAEKEEVVQVEVETENHDLSNYEEQQEENAIISLEELVQKSKDMYAQNELTQYVDEGNEPISLKELEEKAVLSKPKFEDEFSIQNVVPAEEVVEVMEEVRPTVKLDDFNTIEATTTAVEPVKKFKSSPIISPIFGIEKDENKDTNMELENTANYDKLDAEIKRTNEFLLTLKDLQKKLD